MKKIFLIFIIFISCKTIKTSVLLENTESVVIEVNRDNDIFVQIKGIPIIAWDGVREHTLKRYIELSEAGIDHNLTYYPNADVLDKALDMAKSAQVKLIIYCPEMFIETEKIVNRFRGHPALAGYHLIDEPNCNDFQYCGELVRKIQNLDNEHFCYINIFPNIASSKQHGTSTYLEYVQLFLQEVPVQFLSFDHYPIILNSSKERSLRDEWYENLEIISDEARKAGKSFWAFALTTAHWSYPIPTLADLRLQVYSNLAYGAQGIQYFTYWTPPFGADGIDYNNGPIDNIIHQKTSTWYIIQQMNKEIKALSNVFLGSQVIQLRHIVKSESGEDEEVPIGTMRFDFDNRPIEANIIKKFTIPNNTNAVVSFLKNGNRCYMIVINRNLDGGNDVIFSIEGDAGLQIINKDGTVVPVSSENNNQTVIPGDVLIYGWNI